MPLLEWLKAVPTPLAGTAYEPWVQLLQFLLVVSILLSAIIWVLTRRHVRTVAHWVWSLIPQVAHAYEHASQYPPSPAAEQRAARWTPYLALVFFGSLAIVCLIGSLITLAAFHRFLVHNVWSSSVFAALAWGWCVMPRASALGRRQVGLA